MTLACCLTPTGGSSPLARGLLARAGLEALGLRIIPARAGFTAARSSRQSARRDHPRSRGVYDSLSVTLNSASGSSPLARGLLLRPEGVGLQGGIIPARAGFTRT